MTCWEFTLILRHVAEMTDSLANALYDAGCDDATVGSSSGVARVSFSREAATLQDAIQSAVRDVHRLAAKLHGWKSNVTNCSPGPHDSSPRHRSSLQEWPRSKSIGAGGSSPLPAGQWPRARKEHFRPCRCGTPFFR